MTGRGVALAVVALIVALDQVTKLAVRSFMHLGQSVELLPGVLYLTYIHNTGAAFGVLPDRRMIFIVASLGIIAMFSWLLLSGQDVGTAPRSSRLAIVLVLGGAIGNLIDRVWLGQVTDFLDVRVWPVFNVADSSIVLGACLLVLAVLVGSRRREAVRETAGEGTGEAG